MNKKQLVTSIVPMIFRKANTYAKKHGLVEYADELASEGAIAAMECVNSWDESKGKLTTYADDAINWAFAGWVKTRNRKGYNILNNVEQDINLDYLPTKQLSQYDRILREQVVEAFKALSDSQQETVRVYIQCDASPRKMAQHLGICEQAVDQRMRVIIKNIRKIL